jgi:enoyl-CoA hydratase/carnithine racemase
VQRVVPRERLYPESEALARELLAQPQSALRLAKRAVVEGSELGLGQGLALERRLAAHVLAKK